MAISKPMGTHDPLAGIAWDANVAMLALQKILANEPVSSADRESLQNVLVFLDAMRESASSAESPSRRKRAEASFLMAQFFYRRSDRGRPAPAGHTIKPSANNLAAALSTNCPDPAIVRGAQHDCLLILQSANQQRSPQFP